MARWFDFASRRPEWRDPRPASPLDLLRTVAGALFALLVAGLAVALVPLYGLFADERGDGLGEVWPAALIAWGGLVFGAVVAVSHVWERVRYGRPIGWGPAVAVPVIVEAWLLGLVFALALSELR
ncbi:hypothetical protein [Nocardia jiangsuensis]|uniref:Uncharacterized protein n=1 Tax=Nocardia jiangsuensis TaxID=1691563 RepID=A0ABV8DUS4_9NOCA